MIEMNVKSDVDALLRRFPALRREVRKATSFAINDAARKTRTTATRAISQRMNLRRMKMVRESLAVTRSTPSTLTGSVTGRGRALPLSEFKGVKQTPTGVTAQFDGRSVFIRSGFEGKGWAPKHFFRRVGDKRLPIYELRGPSVPTAMARQQVRDAMSREGGATFFRRLRHHFNRLVQRALR